jgi:hypothetical protein
VAIDEDQGGAVVKHGNDMIIPDLLIEGARLGCHDHGSAKRSAQNPAAIAVPAAIAGLALAATAT